MASVGTLDQLAQNQQHKQKFTVVGYGLQDVRPTQMAARTRLRATTRLVNLKSALTDGFNNPLDRGARHGWGYLLR